MRVLPALLLVLTSSLPGRAAVPFEAKVAIIGGTHVRDAFFERKLVDDGFTLQTELGESPRIHRGEFASVRFYYVPAHGGGKWLETWRALTLLGVKEALGGATAGGINPVLRSGDYVIPSDLIDLNVDRPKALPRAVFPNLPSGMIRYNPPIDTELHRILHEETLKRVRRDRAFDATNVHPRATLVQAKGGRFETVAEVRMMAHAGGDLVTANVGTEMIYARQAGIHYACLAVISNPAEGVGEWSYSDLQNARALIPVTVDILLAVLPRLNELASKPRIGDEQRATPEKAQVDPGLPAR